MIGSLASLLACVLVAQTFPISPAPPAAATPQATRPEDRCSLEGTITSAKTGQPLGKAEIEVRRVDANSQVGSAAVSDSAGHYIVENLEPGRYALSASRNAYLRADYGSETRKRGGTLITLSSGQHLTLIDLKLLSQAVVTGRVIDEGNEALANVTVSLLARAYQNGRRTLVSAGAASTNDKGEYRLFGVAPGKYFVLAALGNSGGRITASADPMAPKKDQASYPLTYYPGALSLPEASSIQLAAGAEMDGVDFHLFKVKAFSIAGTLLNSGSLRNFTIQLMPQDSDSAAAWDGRQVTMANSEGKFVFRGIAPGRYQLVASQFTAESLVSARAEVAVSNTDVEVSLEFGQNPDLPGSVHTDDPADVLKPGISIALQNEGTALGFRPAHTREDGTFVLKSVARDRSRLALFPMPEGHYIKSVQLGNVPCDDTLLDLTNGVPGELSITLSAKGAAISGTVQDDQQKPVPNSTVVLIPDDRTLRSRYQTASPDQLGQYTLKAIHPGAYKVFAFDNAEYSSWLDAEWLKPYETKGVSIEVKELEKASKNLPLIVTSEQ